MFYIHLKFVDDDINNKIKSKRTGPHPIGQNGQLVKRSLGPKSQVPDPQSQIPDPESHILRVEKKNSGKKFG